MLVVRSPGGGCPHPNRTNVQIRRAAVANRGHVLTTSATTWSGGACVDRPEDGWLASPELQGNGEGTPAEWAEETHRAARYIWEQRPESRVVDDAYYGEGPVDARSSARHGGAAVGTVPWAGAERAAAALEYYPEFEAHYPRCEGCDRMSSATMRPGNSG
jgi:hypothetical protein